MKNEKPLLSIIVPVYRVPLNLLDGCLRSLTGDRSLSLEIIVIDDGSPDKCGVICDAYSADDERLRVIHTENRGVSVARNTGMEHALGKWLTFVDGDDRVPNGFLREVMSRAEEVDDSVQIVQYLYEYCDEFGNTISKWRSSAKRTMPSSIEIADAILRGAPAERSLGISNVFYGTPWGRLYRKEFILSNALRFPEGIKKRQDAVFCVSTMSKHPNQVLLPKIGYHYVINDQSTTRKYRPDAFDVMYDAFCAMQTCVETYFCSTEYKKLEPALKALAFSFLRDALEIGLLHKDCPLSKSEVRRQFHEEYYKRWHVLISGCDGRGVPKQARMGLCLLERGMVKEYIYLRQIKYCLKYSK